MAAFNAVFYVTQLARLIAGDMLRRKLPAYLVITFILALTCAMLLATLTITSCFALFMVLATHGMSRDMAAPLALLCLGILTSLCALALKRLVYRPRWAQRSAPMTNIQNIADAFFNGFKNG